MSFKIHNIYGLYNLEPKSVVCFAYEPKTKKLAVVRNNSPTYFYIIEIWNIENVPFTECTFAGQKDNSIEAILWVGSRLFTCGQSGMIVEYDVTACSVKNETAVTGSAAWCMDVNHDLTRLAVGTENGYINTFFITEESLLFERIFDKQKGRILCIKWDNTGDMIYTGSVDTIRVWNVSTGHAIHKMLTSRKESKKETVVWCLAVSNDNMIISGDSRGVLSFWDPNMGTLIESHESHIADILTLTLSYDKNTIYCAGTDPVIRTFSRVVVKSSGRAQWVRGIERRLHFHDVRALVEANGKLYSAGVDGYLAQSSYPPKMLVKFPPLPQIPCVYTCLKSRCIMLRYHNYLELWKLGSTLKSNQDTVEPGYIYQLKENPENILQLKSRQNEYIVDCAITNDSRLIVYSTDTYLKVFNYNIINGVAKLSKQDSDLPKNKKVQKMLFSANSKIFVTASYERNRNIITLYKVNKDYYLSFYGSFTTVEEKIKSIGLICLSQDNKYLICSDHESHIAIYNIEGDLSTESLKAYSIPKYSCPPTAMAVQENTNNLVIVYSDHKIVEYNINRRKYTEFSINLQNQLPPHWLARHFPVVNIIFEPSNENVIIMHDYSTVFVVNKCHDFPNSSTKIPRLDNGFCKEESSTSSGNSSQHPLRPIKKYKHLVHLDWVSNTELVAVEVNPISLTEKLPPTLKQKRFGM